LHLLQCAGLIPWHPEERWRSNLFYPLEQSGLSRRHPEERWRSNPSYPVGVVQAVTLAPRWALTEPIAP
jgi:hypothetical protein